MTSKRKEDGMKVMYTIKKALPFLCVIVALTFSLQENSYALVSARDINDGIDMAIKTVREKRGGSEIIDKAKGLLVFPGVFKAGIGIGGEYGEGGLRVHGKTVAYYSIAAASIGFQLGGEKKSIVIAFMTDEAFNQFKNSDGWRAGVDASVAVIALGAGTEPSTATTNKPIVAFVFGQKGLMYDLSLEGAKVSKIQR